MVNGICRRLRQEKAPVWLFILGDEAANKDAASTEGVKQFGDVEQFTGPMKCIREDYLRSKWAPENVPEEKYSTVRLTKSDFGENEDAVYHENSPPRQESPGKKSSGQKSSEQSFTPDDKKSVEKSPLSEGPPHARLFDTGK